MTECTVYGLRLKGDKEVRYIGQTVSHPAVRLAGHYASMGTNSLQPALHEWLRENRGSVEAFAIAKVDSRSEALAMEKAIIALCVRLEHRLLNQRCLPRAERKAA